MTPEPSGQAWAEAVAALQAARRLLIVAHCGPDADALGSALALGLAGAGPGREVAVSVGEPGFTVPCALAALPGQWLVVPPPAGGGFDGDGFDGDRFDGGGFDCCVAVDSASRDRLGTLATQFDHVHPSIAVDHHLTHVPYADITLVDPAAPATATLIAELIDRCGWQLQPDAATCLYAALLTDTGSFRLPTVDPAVHRQAADLLDAGADPGVGRSLLDSTSPSAMRLLGRAIDRMEIDEAAADGLGMVLTVIDEDDLRSCGAEPRAAEGIIGVLRQVSDIDVACVIRPAGSGPSDWTVSLRSRGGTDVAAAARSLGGGGHRCAAGAEVTDVPAADLVQRVRRLCGADEP